MKKVRLRRSDLLVSPIAFGAWELGVDLGATDEAGAMATIRHAADSGINAWWLVPPIGVVMADVALWRRSHIKRMELK